MTRRVLVAGWFSFEQMGATAGDLMSRDLVCTWLRNAGCIVETAAAPPFPGDVDWQAADPERYTDVVFICGPFGNGGLIPQFLERFRKCRLVGLNLSMLDAINVWNPFDLLWERDSSRSNNPDLVFLSDSSKVPVVGLVLVHKQGEYRDRGLHDAATDAIQRLLRSREMSIVPIDTRLDFNSTGLRTPAEVESLIARMDVVVTTRLHGTVLALKNGVPVVAVDPIAGGAKIKSQAERIGWPVVLTADSIRDRDLTQALEYCLTNAARQRARECGQRAKHRVAQIREEVTSAFES